MHVHAMGTRVASMYVHGLEFEESIDHHIDSLVGARRAAHHVPVGKHGRV